jgi:hypothetical protein
MTTNLWTVGQGLVTRRLVPKPGTTPLPAAPKRTSRTGAKETTPASAPAPAAVAQPKPQPQGPRRVKKKGRAKR